MASLFGDLRAASSAIRPLWGLNVGGRSIAVPVWDVRSGLEREQRAAFLPVLVLGIGIPVLAAIGRDPEGLLAAGGSAQTKLSCAVP